jgi:RNA polymerase sigma factor (sigma-70 family)
MALHNLVSTPAEEAALDRLLREYDAYIFDVVSEKARRLGSSNANPEVLDFLEIDEIVQHVRIKLWNILHRSTIESPKGYITAMVENQIRDLMRQRKSKRPLPLLMDEEGELYAGTPIATPQEYMRDPALEFEQAETISTLVEQIVDAVSSLPRRQRQAMISALAERVDDVPGLVEAFKKRRVDVFEGWPEDEADKQRLKASLSVARKKVKDSMAIKQAALGATEKTPVVQRQETSPAEENELPALGSSDRTYQGAGLEPYIPKLREPYREAVRLHYVKKHTYQQIADELNLPLGTAKSHVSRGMKLLHKLKEREPDLQEASKQKTDIAELVARAGTLKEPYRTFVILHYVRKRTYQQIASQFNLPKGTVKSYISRGMKRLHESAKLLRKSA